MTRLFQHLLEWHEHERHHRILASAARAGGTTTYDDGVDGFLPPEQAATVMGVDEDELADLTRRGLLEWRQIGDEAWVRPAVVRVLGVRSSEAG